MIPFPLLKQSSCRITSPATTDYNCIAWAAGEDFRWWWPLLGIYYWPTGVPYEETIDAFILAFRTLGFNVCSDGVFEADFEKVVIYATAAGTVKHMARQLPDGTWTSKLGSDVDIQHQAPHDVEGPAYGSAVQFLKRRGRRLTTLTS
jgi:hypothetical protein